jgi:hypothetical protein
MELKYNDADISDLTTTTRAELTQYLNDHVDTLTLAFANRDGTWTGWKPARGDTVTVTEGNAKSGIMKVMTVRPENGEMILDCVPILELQAGEAHAWKDVTFSQLAKAKAKRLGLVLEMYGIEDQKYKNIIQNGESDLTFMHNLCNLEGVEMMISDSRMRLISDDYIAKIEDSQYVINAQTYRVFDNDYFKRCEITDGEITGKAGKDGAGVYLKTDRKLESIGQANRFAANMLTLYNNRQKGGNITVDEMLDYVMAGSKLQITCDYWEKKTVVVTAVRFDFIKPRTKIWFRTEG